MTEEKSKVREERVGTYFVSTGCVSTGGEGLDTEPSQVAPHLIFETRIFQKNEEIPMYEERSATEEEALPAHAKAVKFAKREERKSFDHNWQKAKKELIRMLTFPDIEGGEKPYSMQLVYKPPEIAEEPLKPLDEWRVTFGDKVEIDLNEWTNLVEKDPMYSIIRQEMVGTYFVSTVWIGIDIVFGQVARPLIFETMIFHENEEQKDLSLHMYQERYATEEEALEGHAKAVCLVKRSIWIDDQKEKS